MPSGKAPFPSTKAVKAGKADKADPRLKRTERSQIKRRTVEKTKKK